MASCILSCSARSRRLKHLRVGLESARSPGFENSMAEDVGAEVHCGMKQQELAGRNTRSNDFSEVITIQKVKRAASRFLICVENKGYVVSLEKRKIYVALPDSMALKHGQVRVIDESGEDYLYPKSLFLPITIPHRSEKLS
jgi:hypothetical protein